METDLSSCNETCKLPSVFGLGAKLPVEAGQQNSAGAKMRPVTIMCATACVR
jgi:hypothetical protein